jgi:hypothetical protein
MFKEIISSLSIRIRYFFIFEVEEMVSLKTIFIAKSFMLLNIMWLLYHFNHLINDKHRFLTAFNIDYSPEISVFIILLAFVNITSAALMLMIIIFSSNRLFWIFIGFIILYLGSLQNVLHIVVNSDIFVNEYVIKKLALNCLFVMNIYILLLILKLLRKDD